MRIAIFGAGAVGGYFGGRLAAAGADVAEVAFVARGAHLEALRRDGLRILSPAGDLHLPEVEASDDPGELAPVDVVVVAVKTWQLEEAVPGIRRLLGAETWVLPLLNGVEAATVLAAALGPERVVGGTCEVISRLGAPGEIVHVGATPRIALGELDGRPSRRTEALRDAFRAAGVEAEVPPDVHAAIWRKFLFVVSVGGVGAATREPIGVTRRLPASRALLERAMAEIEALARARGVALPAGAVGEALAFVDTLPPEGTASLQRDLAAGRRSELEAWTGAVVRLARESGVAAPTHDLLYSVLLSAELRARGELGRA